MGTLYETLERAYGFSPELERLWAKDKVAEIGSFPYHVLCVLLQTKVNLQQTIQEQYFKPSSLLIFICFSLNGNKNSFRSHC